MRLNLSSRQVIAGAALLLVAIAIWPWFAPAGTAASTAGTERTSLPPPLPALPPLASLSAIAERPLFAPTRRPTGAAAAPAAANMPGHYRLLGVIGVGDSRRALVVDGPRRIEVNEGGALDAWTLKRIEADRVVLTSPQGETVLNLQRAAPETSPTTPR